MAGKSILESDHVYHVVEDEILNHWVSRGGHCSCGDVYYPSPQNTAKHVAWKVVNQLRATQEELEKLNEQG